MVVLKFQMTTFSYFLMNASIFNHRLPISTAPETFEIK